MKVVARLSLIYHVNCRVFGLLDQLDKVSRMECQMFLAEVRVGAVCLHGYMPVLLRILVVIRRNTAVIQVLKHTCTHVQY